MTNRKMTDGERIAIASWKRQHGDQDSAFQVELAKDIDRVLRKRQAEAWLEGWRRSGHDFPGNPYQGRKRKV